MEVLDEPANGNHTHMRSLDWLLLSASAREEKVKVIEHAIMVAMALLSIASSARSAHEAASWNSIHLTARAVIEAGALAQTRAHSPEIRNLGRLVVRDISELDRRLAALAAKAGIQLASGPIPGKIQLTELGSLHGGIFDRKFLNFNYGASEALLHHMRDAEGPPGRSALHELVAIFGPIVRQDQFLSDWCLAHCLPRKNP